MRKQYHFRDSARGLLCWDVDRLVELSRDFEIERLPLSEIVEIDEEYWFDNDGTRPTCRRIAEHMKLVDEACLDHAIILDAEGRIFDGMHRVVKALLAGHESIRAVRFVRNPKPDHVGRRPDELPT